MFKRFLGRVIATLVALAIFFGFLFSIVLGIGAAAGNMSKVVAVEENSVLNLVFDKPILEQDAENPLSELGLPISNGPDGIGIPTIIKSIAYAKTDDHIKGIYLKCTDIQAGAAQLDEIRESLLDFKASGKFIYAFSNTYKEQDYYLASVADRIFLNPAGLLELNGISYRNIFIKGLLDKLELKADIFRVGDYKSAVEPLMLDRMSPENKKQTLAFISSINEYHLRKIASARNIPYNVLHIISDSMLVHNAQDALNYKLVTDLGYYDQVYAAMKEVMVLDSAQKINFVRLEKYQYTVSDTKVDTKDKIAVIIGEGEIADAGSDPETIYGDVFAATIRKARLDKNIKAIVLRINSPGGSALASDVMWREVTLATAQKPVIASMSDVAASGGYYMAMGCTKIVAKPNSITGSIGVFGVLIYAEEFLKNKLGVTADGVKTGLFSDVGDPTRKLTTHERQAIQQEVQRTYDDFVNKAASARRLTIDSIRALASGRVWSGLQAYENGLVDQLGGLQDAICLAAQLADIDKYTIQYMPEKKDFIMLILNEIQGNNESKMWISQPKIMQHIWKTYQSVQQMQGIQARLEGHFNW